MADTISDKLTRLNEVKQQIKQSIINKGVQVADDTPFRNYADKIGEISGGGEPVEKTKFGVGIDNILGNVDANGQYIPPSVPFEINLSGIKSVGFGQTLAYAFYSSRVKKAIINDLVSVNSYSFNNTFSACAYLEEALIESLEEVPAGDSPFGDAFSNCSNLKTVKFSRLKKVSAISAFRNCFNYCPVLRIDEVFPALEEISGTNTFNSFVSYNKYATTTAVTPIRFPKLKKITGPTSQYSSIFGGLYVQNTVWNFPSATEFTGYIWNVSTSYPGEIHFAAANQAAIEACDGYANKWGFAGATIFFDL